jgi:UDP-N-acetylglucosamine 2-epimerase
MLQSTIVIGNSSSGVLEAPIAGVPSIDVGERQKGRVSPKGICQVSADRASIQSAIVDILESSKSGPAFTDRPADETTVSKRIVRAIVNRLTYPGLAKKAFVDL